MTERHHGWDASLKPPFIGFIASLVLLTACYQIIVYGELSRGLLTMTIAGFAFFQALIQLVFFLHLGLESKPHWNSITFLFTVLVLILIVGGSIWIMHHLSYNLMPPMNPQ